MSKKECKQYFTVKEVMEAAVLLAKTDPRFAEAEKMCPLDYELVCSSVRYDKLFRCDFEVVGAVTYGTSEGIWGNVFIYGSWNEETGQRSSYSTMRGYVLKTLSREKDPYFAMGVMVTLIAYYANEFVRAHLDHFD